MFEDNDPQVFRSRLAGGPVRRGSFKRFGKCVAAGGVAVSCIAISSCTAIPVSQIGTTGAASNSSTSTAQADVWPTYRGFAGGTASNVADTSISTKTAASLHLAWDLRPASPTESVSSPLVSGQTVIVTRYQIGKDSRSAPLGRVTALQLTSGKQLWSRSYPRSAGVLAVTDGVAITELGQMYVNVAGQWAYPELTGLSVKTGAVLWTIKGADNNAQWGRGFLGGGRLYMPITNATVVLDPLTGKYLERTAFNTSLVWSTNRLFGGGPINAAEMFDQNTGRQLAVYGDGTGEVGGFWGLPIAYANKLYAVSSQGTQPKPKAGAVEAFPTTGCGQQQICTQIWRTWFADPIREPATAQNGRLFVVGVYGGVYALDANTGRLLWQSHQSGAFLGAPATANGVLYIVRSDGTVLAYAQAGCGKSVCAPIATIPDPRGQTNAYDNPPIVTQGLLLYTTTGFGLSAEKIK